VAVDRLELIWNYPMYLKMHTLRAHFFTQWGILDSVPRTELLKQQLIQQYAPQPNAGVDTTSVPLLQESEVVGVVIPVLFRRILVLSPICNNECGIDVCVGETLQRAK
jgi:hypothetical protein